MPAAASTLREHLAGDERLTAVHSATLSEDASWKPVSVGVTDRRLVCVSDDGTVVNVGHDSMCTIRSRPRTTATYRGNDYRLLVAIGGLVAVLSFAAVVSTASSLLVPLLVPAVAGGLASAEYQRRSMDGPVADPGDRVADTAARSQVLLVANGLVAVVGFLGIVVVEAGVLVPLLALSTVGGLAVVDYARRHRSDFDGIEVVRRREREVSVGIDDGSTIHIRVDRSDEIDRVLGRIAFGSADGPVRPASPRS